MFWLYRYAAVDRSMAGLSAENSPISDGRQWSSLVAAAPNSLMATESPPSTIAVPAHNTRGKHSETDTRGDVASSSLQHANFTTLVRRCKYNGYDGRYDNARGACVRARRRAQYVYPSRAGRPGWLMCGGDRVVVVVPVPPPVGGTKGFLRWGRSPLDTYARTHTHALAHAHTHTPQHRINVV